MASCPFDRAWIGPCGEPGDPYCEKHKGKMCRNHPDQQATHECSSAGSLVCGQYCCKIHTYCNYHS